MPQSHAHWTSDLLLWSSVLLTEATKLRYCETLPGDLSPSILQQGQGVQDPTDHREISSLQKANRNSCSIETKSSSRCPVLISALFPLSLSLSLSLSLTHTLSHCNHFFDDANQYQSDLEASKYISEFQDMNSKTKFCPRSVRVLFLSWNSNLKTKIKTIGTIGITCGRIIYDDYYLSTRVSGLSNSEYERTECKLNNSKRVSTENP